MSRISWKQSLFVVLVAGSIAAACSSDNKTPAAATPDAGTCGNGKLDPGEVCDSALTSFPGKTCATEKGPGSTGALVCAADCKSISTQACSATTGGTGGGLGAGGGLGSGGGLSTDAGKDGSSEDGSVEDSGTGGTGGTTNKKDSGPDSAP